MQGIILCGGLGTRLRIVIGERQKSMVETNGEPFILNTIKYFKKYNIDDIIFATGYKKEEVSGYFGDGSKFSIKTSYAIEDEPLGTGGAIRNCLPYINTECVIVINGDTLFPVDIDSLLMYYNFYNADMCIACKCIDDKKRYGTINFKNIVNNNGTKSGIIESFAEKTDIESSGAYINGGVYIIKSSLIETIANDKVISLEKELMPMWLKDEKVICGMISNESFIDIGTPETLAEFKRKFGGNAGWN